MDDEALDTAIHRADLDELVRLVDACCESRDWQRLLRLRDRSRHAVATGRQLWPAATLAEYRLALLAPPDWAAQVLDEASGRFTIGPLTEVIAQHHSWTDLRDVLEPGPRAALVAHERVIRGEPMDESDVDHLPNTIELPYELAGWEPAYCVAEYRDVGAEFPSPEPSRPRGDDLTLTLWHGEAIDDDPVVEAVRQLVEPWTSSSNGRCDAVAVDGTASDALAALGLSHARVTRLDSREALAWLGWAGSSGGAFGRRRGAAMGRFGVWWLLAALGDVAADWPVPADELGTIVDELQWSWFDAGEPATGWQLQLTIEDPEDGFAWAINARDAS